MARRVISEIRQYKMRVALVESRSRYRSILKRSRAFQAGRGTNEELQLLDREIDVLRDEIRGYIAELEGRGPMPLSDRWARLWNDLSLPKMHLRDVARSRLF